MTAQEIIRWTLENAHGVLKTLLADLSDEELLVRPTASANHIAWQLGHLIRAEHGIMSGLPGADMPSLPNGFRERYTPDTSKSDDRCYFGSKSFYLELFDRVRAATLATLSRQSDVQLSAAAPEAIRKLAPTVGAMFAFLGQHELMHAGQFSATRRKLGKPVSF